MENVNVSMITKKKEIISLILILPGRREKKNVSKKMLDRQLKLWDFQTLFFVHPNEQGLSSFH